MVTSMGLLGACQEPAHEPQNPPSAASAAAPPNASSVTAPVAPPASAERTAPAVASVAPLAAPSATVALPPAASPQGARLAMFIARTLRAPGKLTPAERATIDAVLTDANAPGNADMDSIQNSCGLSNRQSESLHLTAPTTNSGLGGIGGPSEVVQVGLAPHPGMTPLEQLRARIAISGMVSGIASCLAPLARKNPKLLGASLRVSAATTGDRARTTLTLLPNGTADDVKTCVTGAIAPLLIGDTTHAQLLFDVRIDKTPK